MNDINKEAFFFVMPWPHYCHSALDAESRGQVTNNSVLSLHEPPFWIPAGVYPREGGDGNDALGKLRLMSKSLT
jgi:hypothetical protein